MDEVFLKQIIEALLMASGQPISIDKLQAILGDELKPTRLHIETALAGLETDYANRSIELKCLASGYCFQTKKQFSSWITRLFAEKPVKYSGALLEILSIIAYRQPVTRAEIEDIRGVAVSSSIIKTLLEREWVRIAGHRDIPGKPAVYVTTKIFLDYFNLASLNELPSLGELK